MCEDDIKSRIGRLIDQRMTAMNMADAELARRLGTNRQRIGSWRKGKVIPRPEIAPLLAQELSLPLSAVSADPSHVNVAEPSANGQTKRQVPRIDWIQAGKQLPSADPYPIGHGRDLVDIRSDVSGGAFALDVRGDSMEPDFAEGDVLIIDPATQPWAGCFVVAELLPELTDPGNGDKTFKRYKPRGVAGGVEVFDLEPLNPEYPTITVNRANPGRVIGVVVERHQRFSRR